MFGIPKRTLIVIAVLAGVIVLYVLGKDRQPGGTSPASTATRCTVEVTVDSLNVRAAPDVRSARVDSYSRGRELTAEKVVQNGFRKIGENRWVANEFVRPLSGSDC